MPPQAQHNESADATRCTFDLRTEDGVRAYLSSANYRDVVGQGEEFSLERLVGGTANWIYRVTSAGGGDGTSTTQEEQKPKMRTGTKTRTTILKHAAPVLASSSFELSTERMDYEARFLARATDALQTNHRKTGQEKEQETSVKHDCPSVKIPSFVFYDDKAKLLCLSDAGSANLRDSYAQLDEAHVRRIADALGAWLAGFHAQTPKEYITGSPSEPEEAHGNNLIGVGIAGYTYSLLAGALAQHKQAGLIDGDIDVLSAAGARFAALIPRDEGAPGAGVCHGDFWPGNVVLDLIDRDSSDAGKDISPTVIDWELTRLGSSSTDIGQFAAEAYMLDLFRGAKGLFTSFVRAYLRSAGVGVPDARGQDSERASDESGCQRGTRMWYSRIAVHFAVHIVVWPGSAVHWARQNDTRVLVHRGTRVLSNVAAGGIGEAFWELVESGEE